MLAKKTIKNQITLPKAVVARFAGVQYFDVSTDGECIVLRPLQKSRVEEVRAKLAQLGVGVGQSVSSGQLLCVIED